ncbi:MAG: exo-alpha-sialidase, partial [Eubacterium sp.]|nr:exo-alpha-sialidase [Eubacterium sp.]
MGKIIFKKSDYRYSSAIIGAKENVLLAAAVKCSQNIDKGISWGYNEIVAKISSDGGESWSEEKTVLAPPARKITADEGNTKSAFFINPTLLTAPNGDFVIVFTFYPECMGEEDEKLLDKKKTPFTGFNSKTYPVLYDRDGNYFIVLEDGKVIDSSKQPTEYTVKGLGELYRGEEYLGNIHLNGAMGKSEGLGKTSFGAPLKSPKRSYIMMIKSSDGINWSEPKDITPNVICESDGACVRTSKGNGAVCENGRMIVPLTAPKGAAFIYSDDNGESWNRNMRMPYIPVKEDISVLQTSGGELLAVG